MATELVCDRCGSKEGTRHTAVAAGMQAWTLDLCTQCSEALEEQIRALVPDARPAQSRALRRSLENGGQPQRAYYAAAEGLSMTEIRKWAQAEGLDVAPTGRVSQDVIAAYRRSKGF